MTKMLNAKQLYEISQQRIPELVDEIMKGVKEHIIEQCKREANRGATYYTIYLKEGNRFIRNKLVEECLELAGFFEREENGFKVSIDDGGSDTRVIFYFTVSWNGKPHIVGSYGFGKNEHVYDTDNGFNDDYLKKIKEMD